MNTLRTRSPLDFFSASVGGLLLLISVLVTTGWVFSITTLKSIFPGITPMNPNVAICFGLTGMCFVLLVSVRNTKSRWYRVIRGFVIFTALIALIFGFVRMLGILGIVDIPIDEILFHKELMTEVQFAYNRIAPNTAFNLIILSIMLVLLAVRRFLRVAQALASIMFFIALLAIVGYFYEVKNLYGFLSYTPMALNTAICFCLTSFAVLSSMPKGYFADVMFSTSPGGLISRRLSSAILVLPILLGYLSIWSIENGLFDVNYGTAIYTVSIIALFLGIILSVVYRINLIDRQRLIAERQVQEAQQRTEAANAKLDSQLQETIQKNASLEETKRAMLNLLEDLSNTKKDLEQKNNQDDALLESIGDAVFAVDAEGKLILFNPVAEMLSGRSAAEVKGKHYTEALKFVREDSDVETYAFIESALAGKKSSMEMHTMLVDAKGKRIPVSDSASPLIDSTGKVTGAVVVFRDVTREREVDKAKTEFVSLASHQLRTPLSAIGWYSELLLDGEAGKVTKRQKEFLSQIAESNTRMVDLVNSLLNVSRIDMGTLASDPEPTDIVQLCESVLAELAPQIATRSLHIEKTFSAPKIVHNVDPRLMRIIIQNLLSNAVKYTPEKGSVFLSLIEDDSFMHLDVRDTGYGIPKDQQHKIFTKLFRADNAQEKDPDGNGLGLYVVKSVVEAHGGKIWFDSEENKGTTFHVELPVSGMKKIEGSKTLS